MYCNIVSNFWTLFRSRSTYLRPSAQAYAHIRVNHCVSEISIHGFHSFIFFLIGLKDFENTQLHTPLFKLIAVKISTFMKIFRKEIKRNCSWAKRNKSK